jgi:hypothetical protein
MLLLPYINFGEIMSDKNNGKLVGEQVKFIGDIAEKTAASRRNKNIFNLGAFASVATLVASEIANNNTTAEVSTAAGIVAWGLARISAANERRSARQGREVRDIFNETVSNLPVDQRDFANGILEQQDNLNSLPLLDRDKGDPTFSPRAGSVIVTPDLSARLFRVGLDAL